MKRFWIRFMIGISFLAAFVGVKCMPVKAATPAGLKEEWRTLRDYPIPYGDERLGQFMYEDVLDINNPPEDMLLDFSTSELAELTLRYPYLNDMLGVAETDMRVYWSAFEGNSFIFRELLWREGGVEAILDVYEAMPFDVRSLNEIGNFTRGFMKVSSFRDEVFIREFVSYYLSRFTENEAERYLDIREQRDKEFYLKIQDESIREYLLKDLDMTLTGKYDLVSVERMQAKWREAIEYPLTQEDPTWKRRTSAEKWRILNPPGDILGSIDTPRLVELVLTHPLLWEYGNDLYMIFPLMERNSNLFSELQKRQDGNQCILEAYASNDLNVLAASTYGINSTDASVRRERIFCHYVDQYSDEMFSEEDIMLYEQIYREKKKTYEGVKNEKLREQFDTCLSVRMEANERMESEEASEGQDEISPDGNREQKVDLAGARDEEEGGCSKVLPWIIACVVVACICCFGIVLYIRKKHKSIT